MMREGKFIVAVTVLVFACLLASNASAQLMWKFTSNEKALCNDFTRAGFFHRNGSDMNKKWVIFLESGSLCYSNGTCNRRYFQPHVRERYSTYGSFGEFDTTVAWESTGLAAQSFAEFVNPLMTSLYCFRNETRYFGSSEEFSVEGRDILSSDCIHNPTFCHHGHVMIPYCSSDVWLGKNENYVSKDNMSTKKEPPCDCWDQECFKYNPTSKELQFTFRGQIIFKSVLQTLDEMYNLQEAEEIVLIGSSAGGIGVLNLVNWVRKEYSNVSIKVVIDSSWFINFRDSINQEFGSLNYNDKNSSMFGRLLDSHNACNDTRLGYPCCLSTQCILTQSNPNTEEPYYPHDVPLFSITSLYDVFLLANSLANVVSKVSDQISPTGLAVQFISTIGEYGGAMNASVIETSTIVSSTLKFSYYATQCFQHIYFASSSLLESNNLLTAEVVLMDQNYALFRHTVQSGVWNGHNLAYFEGRGYTIREAINYWYHNGSEVDGGVVFRDQCYGPRCNDECPEELILQEQEAKNWSTSVKIGIAVLVVAIAAICLLLKLYCCIWLKWLHWKQHHFLADKRLHSDEETPFIESSLNTIREVRFFKFPDCTDNNAISVACLNLHYSVTVGARTQIKDERRDTHSPQTLSGLSPVNRRNSVQQESLNVERKHQNAVHLPLTKTHKKVILNSISAYFNPNELIAIMGPSGCGKTTFLDILTGRRTTGSCYGGIFINGVPIEENQNWYLSNTGYVLQLAVPYYEELTVRENLTLAAWVKLHVGTREKFERVEQVMDVTGLLDLADTVVGGATGPGLSGGQKRRLVVALQLLKLPSVLFLDEPTSGLDAASSTELLTHLNTLAASNRTVVLTIHQPRLEIFHMFKRIVVLSEGKVAYQGVPENAYEVFVIALQSYYLKKCLALPGLENHNPADVIMDMLGNYNMRKLVTNYYEESGEPKRVSKAVSEAWKREKEYMNNTTDSHPSAFNTLRKLSIFKPSRQAGRTHNYFILRMAALEARAMERASLFIILYLPVIFFGYGFLLGTVYFQETTPFLILSGFCVYSVASALFMFPALYGYYQRALEIYTFEHADGAGRASDLVIQPFVRFISMAIFPVVICAGVLYVLMVDYSRWDLWVFLQVVVVNIALNQVWTALLIWLILIFPQKAFRLSPVLSAVAGFTSGFFIPINRIPWWYRWLCYINPNFYGFSASAVLLLTHFESDCERDGGSQLECFTSSGQYVLDSFSFGDINPYQNIVILVGMTQFYLIIAVISNWIRFLKSHHTKTKFTMITRKVMKRASSSTEAVAIDSEYESDDDSIPMAEIGQLTANEESDETIKDSGNPTARLRWKKVAMEVDKLKEEHKFCSISPPNEDEPPAHSSERSRKRNKMRSLYLHDGEAHTVWKPKQQSQKTPSTKFYNVVREAIARKNELYERQKILENRVQATRHVLKMKKEELVIISEEEVEGKATEHERLNTSHTSLEIEQNSQHATKKEEEELDSKSPKRSRKMRRFSLHIHNMVSQYAANSPHASPLQLLPLVEEQDGDKNQEDATRRRQPNRRVSSVTKSRRNSVTTIPPRKRRSSQPVMMQEKLKRVRMHTMV